MKNIKFKGEQAEDLIYNPKKCLNTFYQICQYKKNNSKLYDVRKVIFDEMYKIVDIQEKSFKMQELQKFLDKANPNKYKIYPVNNISYIDNPNGSDFIGLTSELTCENQNCNSFDSYNCMMFGNIPNSNSFASPGEDIMKLQRKVTNIHKNYYNGAPTNNNLHMINNNTYY